MLKMEIGTDAWNKNVAFFSATADEANIPDCAIWDEDHSFYFWCETPENEPEVERLARIAASEQRYS